MPTGALLVFGFRAGCLDVSMDAHFVHVEKAYDRPVMSAFHAMFSVGGVIASLVGAGAASDGMSPAVGKAAAGVTIVAVSPWIWAAFTAAAIRILRAGSDRTREMAPSSH
ncbi:hypothetical protein [Streptomyces sp. NPDC059455]|uniref:hypothetical protein n=1 Tax=Streptomyces sp. NPDC059455 TaxID=3346837 RepID=UPI003696C225